MDIVISSKYNLFSPWYSWTTVHFGLNNNTNFRMESAELWRVTYLMCSRIIECPFVYSIYHLWITIVIWIWGQSWSWSHGSWIYYDLCNQCLSPLKLWVRMAVSFIAGGNQSTRRKPPTCRKSLTNFIT
jgi:hypothetical protein